MSFHGGFLGVLIALWFYARRRRKRWLDVTDFVAPLVPLGLAAGRLGNFINGELVGRVTDVPWGMVFPQVDNLPRHPSQLYQLGLEGLLLFVILWTYASRHRCRDCSCWVTARCASSPSTRASRTTFSAIWRWG
jgi:phosphatidylglycerol:prolipoprotein diacylglycerol transferase